MLSLACCTARQDPRWELIIESLIEEVDRSRAFIAPVELVAVDEGIWRDERPCRDHLADTIRGRIAYQHVAPKPTAWRGPHRLTGKDRWDKPSALNTAVCHARYPRIAFFDDESVLGEGWLASHLPPAGGDLAPMSIAGAFRYWQAGAVARGCRVTGTPCEPGDHRLVELPGGGSCPPGWLYGGNASFPLDALLQCNGWDEIMSGARGLEDCELSLRVSRITRTWFRSDSVVNYLTFPAEPAAGEERCKGFDFRDGDGRLHWMTFNHLPIWWLEGNDREKIGDGEIFTSVIDPRRAPHRARATTLGNPFDLRELRARAQAGQPLPLPSGPTHDWRDGQPLRDM